MLGMGTAQDRPEVRRDLQCILGDGLAFSVMVGCGESYFSAFALALGFGDVSAGLVATLPMLVGAVLQLISPSAIAWLGSNRRWVVGCASVQAASFLPLVSGAASGFVSQPMLFFVASIYWGAGMATGPAWNTWVASLVPERLRARFFATRARLGQIALVSGLMAAGWLLESSSQHGSTLAVFAAIFAVASLARWVSAWFLSRQRELGPLGPAVERSALRTSLAATRASGHARLLLYLLVTHFSVYIAAPYFTPYMLGPLGLSYAEFTGLVALAFVARVFSLPALGRMARRLGTRRLLWLGSLGVAPLPALWLVSSHFLYLAVLQLASGVAWAAFELATMLSFFEHIAVERRTRVLSLYNLAHAFAIVAGSALGGWILGGATFSRDAYGWVLAASTLARGCACFLLPEVGDTRVVAIPGALRTISVRPSSGGLQRPILPALDREDSGG